jgi:hypothetical protein
MFSGFVERPMTTLVRFLSGGELGGQGAPVARNFG